MRGGLLEYGTIAFGFAVAVNALYMAVLIISFVKGLATVRYRDRYGGVRGLMNSRAVPPISILVPAYNEELMIVENVRSLLALNYPQFEVIVVNDGSSDNTLAVLVEAFGLKLFPKKAARYQLVTLPIRNVYHNPDLPQLFVIDKGNSGKGDSLNAGINLARYPLICSIDADSILEPDALLWIAKVYMERPAETVALGGNIRVANGCAIQHGRVREVRLPRELLPICQTLEYTKAFMGGRIGWGAINGLLIVSGAFGVFRRDAVVAVGGYSTARPGEDMEIVIRLHQYMLEQKKPYRIVFCPEAVCWTQAPDSLRVLGNQRRRWGRGNLRNMREFARFFGRPAYGVVGMISIPYTILVELFNPYLKITGLMALSLAAWLNPLLWSGLLWLVLLNMVVDYLLSLASLILDEWLFHLYKPWDLLKLVGYIIHVSLWYYYLNDIWRVWGHIEYYRKVNPWGVMTRRRWNDQAP